MPTSLKPRVYTREEVRQQFLDHIATQVQYWDDPNLNQSQDERLSGLAFSILVALDGCSTALPGFVVAPAPHPTDRRYCIAQGEDYYPATPKAACDIAGGLHELLAGAIRRLRASAAIREHQQ
jgi:hypothetical protein